MHLITNEQNKISELKATFGSRNLEAVRLHGRGRLWRGARDVRNRLVYQANVEQMSVHLTEDDTFSKDEM
jgi:hypothetical protein